MAHVNNQDDSFFFQTAPYNIIKHHFSRVQIMVSCHVQDHFTPHRIFQEGNATFESSLNYVQNITKHEDKNFSIVLFSTHKYSYRLHMSYQDFLLRILIKFHFHCEHLTHFRNSTVESPHSMLYNTEFPPDTNHYLKSPNQKLTMLLLSLLSQLSRLYTQVSCLSFFSNHPLN